MSRISVLISKPWRTLGALALLLAAAAVAVGSGAAFTASSANPSNTFSAGSLSMSNSKSGSAILGPITGMKPGDAASTGEVEISNTGSLTGDFKLSEGTPSDAGNVDPVTFPFSGILDLTVTDCGPDLTCGTGDDIATPVYSGKLNAVNAANIDLGNFPATGGGPGGQTHHYQFSVSFPSTVDDNQYKSASTTVEFDWNATT